MTSDSETPLDSSPTMLSDEWTEADLLLAEEAFRRNFPQGRGMGLWTASAVTAREWAGTRKELSSLDTRIQFKNNAEYHGMETHAWQYMTTAQYGEASDHFFAAALWRENDTSEVLAGNPGHDVDSGHSRAILLCIRMARFCRALALAQHSRTPFPEPHEFDLDAEFVRVREDKAQQQIDGYRQEPEPEPEPEPR